MKPKIQNMTLSYNTLNYFNHRLKSRFSVYRCYWFERASVSRRAILCMNEWIFYYPLHECLKDL